MNILLVEDDVGIGRFVSQGLRARGWQVRWERVGKDVPALAGSGRFNTIILDLLLPDSDGLHLCSDIRKAELGIPILMLTARSGLDDRLDGFAAGADDYLAKPFAFEELLARLRALLKRDRLRKPDPVNLGALRVDPNASCATWAGQPIDTNRRVFALLLALARAGGEPVEREKLVDEIWGRDAVVTDNALDVCASLLRRKLASVTPCVVLEAVRGHGYALRVFSETSPPPSGRTR